MEVPVVNKTYKYFDDGKIRVSRMDNVLITEVVPFRKIDRRTKKDWKAEVKSCAWLYLNKTDYFVKGHLERSNEDVVFVRIEDNQWFSLGWWAGLLDLDGSLTKRLKGE